MSKPKKQKTDIDPTGEFTQDYIALPEEDPMHVRKLPDIATKKIHMYTEEKQIVERIVKTSDYHKYEVEDIVSHAFGHLREILMERGNFNFPGIGELRVTHAKGGQVLKLAKVTTVMPDRYTFYFRASPTFKKELKEYHADRANRANQPE